MLSQHCRLVAVTNLDFLLNKAEQHCEILYFDSLGNSYQEADMKIIKLFLRAVVNAGTMMEKKPKKRYIGSGKPTLISLIPV